MRVSCPSFSGIAGLFFRVSRVTVDMFERCVPIDYASLYRTADKLMKVLNAGKEVKLVSWPGTNADHIH